jgi:hypothetical protein
MTTKEMVSIRSLPTYITQPSGPDFQIRRHNEFCSKYVRLEIFSFLEVKKILTIMRSFSKADAKLIQNSHIAFRDKKLSIDLDKFQLDWDITAYLQKISNLIASVPALKIFATHG